MSGRISFIAVTGQRDNLGDSLLRRGIVRAVPAATGRAIFVGGNAEDYVRNLAPGAADIIYTDRAAWLRAIVRASIGRGANLVLNAGELTVGSSSLRDRLLLLPVIVLLRARGGAFIHAGTGLRNPESFLVTPLRWFLRCANVVTWRDRRSAAAARIGSVAPDWAFGEGPGVDTLKERHRAHRASAPRIALSVRGDRASLTADAVAPLAAKVRALGAVPVIVAQVRRDAEAARALAEALGAEVVDWPAGDDHAAQEERLRAVYATCTWVASDRLHVVAAAATEGAVPLDLVPDTHGKVRRTLEPAQLRLVDTDGASASLDEDQAVLLAGLAQASRELADVTRRIRQACG